MHVPGWLDAEGKKYWTKHFKRLVDAGILDPASDSEGFALLAGIYSQLLRVDPDTDSKCAIRYNALLKQYQAYAKQYGMLPKDRKQAKISAKPPDEPDEYGL